MENYFASQRDNIFRNVEVKTFEMVVKSEILVSFFFIFGNISQTFEKIRLVVCKWRVLLNFLV